MRRGAGGSCAERSRRDLCGEAQERLVWRGAGEICGERNRTKLCGEVSMVSRISADLTGSCCGTGEDRLVTAEVVGDINYR